MARAGMANLITEMRVLCQAGTADYSVAGVAYFSDDQIQASFCLLYTSPSPRD